MNEAASTKAARAKFVLHGPEEQFDPRVTPYRADLADIALAGKLFSPHYAEPLPMRCSAPKAMLRKLPGKNHEAISELLHGEDFHLLDVSGDWAWGYCAHDGYVGYVPVHALQHQRKTPEPTHYGIGRAALLFAEPDVKAGVVKRFPMGSRIACSVPSECGKFLSVGKLWVHVRHVQAFGVKPAFDGRNDSMSLAEQLIGAPYLWGGRSGDGLDCSGLIQMVMMLTGAAAPRDSDQQLVALGRDIAEGEELRRGDLVFFPNHVGLMVNADKMIHANSHWMQVIVEPLCDVVQRFKKTHDTPVLARKRLG